jgi:uncharacterized membrane protein YgcG
MGGAHAATHVWRRAMLVALAMCGLSTALPLASFAAGSDFTSPGMNADPLKPTNAIAAGDWIAVGFSVSDHNHSNPATTLYLQSARAILSVTCTSNGTQVAERLSIDIPAGPYFYPADYTANGGWWPTGAAQNAATYQTAVSFQSPCNGGPAYIVNNGEQYVGTLASSNNTGDLFHLQFHTAIPAANKAANIDCGDSAQNPNPGQSACNFPWKWKPDNLTPAAYSSPTPSPTPTPAPTPTPTPTPAPTPNPTPTPAPSSTPSPTPDPGSGGSGGGTGGGSGGSGGTGGGGSGGSASAPSHFYPTTVLGAHAAPAAISAGVQSASTRGTSSLRSSSGVSSDAPNALQPVPVSPSPSNHVSPLLPVPVVSPIVATGSLLEHLPLQWYALLGAVDCVLVLAILARRNRAKASAMKSRELP